MAAYDTTALLASVRRRAMLPSATTTGTADSDLLAYANEELQASIAVLVMSVKEDYFLSNSETALVAAQLTYSLPYRAIGGKLREVSVIDANGVTLREFPRAQVDDLEFLNDGYYIRGNTLVFVVDPTTTTAGTLRLAYFMRPSRLVATSAVAVISAINTSTKTMTTTATVPSSFSTSVTFDLVKTKAGFECLAIDQTATVAAGTTVTFSSTLPTTIAVGDYITLSEESPVPQIPPELHPLLAEMTAGRVLQAQGDNAGLERSQAKSDRLERDALSLLATRVDGAPRKAINRKSLFHMRRPNTLWR